MGFGPFFFGVNKIMLNKRADKLELLRIAEAVALEKSIDKELIINAKNQRNTLVKDFKKTKTRIYFIKLLRFLCFILLLYFLRPIRGRIKKSLEKLEIE